MKMTNRLDALEGKASPPLVEKWHELVALGNQTQDELIDAYGRERLDRMTPSSFSDQGAPAGEAVDLRRQASRLLKTLRAMEVAT